MEIIAQIITNLALKYPVLISILSIIGVLRAINKPLFALLRAYTDATPSVKDDAKLDKLQSSKAYASIVFALDYLTSIKIK